MTDINTSIGEQVHNGPFECSECGSWEGVYRPNGQGGLGWCRCAVCGGDIQDDGVKRDS